MYFESTLNNDLTAGVLIDNLSLIFVRFLRRTFHHGQVVRGDDHGPDEGVRHGPRQEVELLGRGLDGRVRLEEVEER